MAAPVTVRGDRNVVNQGEINDSLIVMGDNTTVNMQLDGAGAVLSWAFRWNRPRPRRRGDRPQAPPRMQSHVDREAEVTALAGGDGAPRIVNVYGEPGIGKTYVLVEALQRRECEGRDGTVYIRDARARSADDLLHAVFGALFETRIPIRDSEIERHLTKPRAVVALEDVDSGTDTGRRLVLAFGRSRLLVTSRDRVLYDGTSLKIAGLDPEHAVAIAEQELGRRLEGAERAAAEQIAVALRGHPFELRRAFGRARDEGRPLDALAPALTQPQDGRERAAALNSGELALARTLAVHDGAPLGSEHIIAILGGPPAAAAARALEARHDARSHSPRYSLEGPLAKAFSGDELAYEVDRALEHFVPWAEREAERSNHEAVLREGRALVALLERATRLGRLEEVIGLGFAIEGALAWGNRWAEWGRVLEIVLDAAQGRADAWAEATALHQLGTRAYGLGNVREAGSTLERALELRERIGDADGAAATRQNLRVVSGPPPLPYRLSHASLALVAAVVALLVVGAGGAVGSGIIDSGGRDRQLTVSLGGDGAGAVAGDVGAIDCEPDCAATLADGTAVVLTPQPARGSEFSGWRGPACRGAQECVVRLTTDLGVTAVFSKLADPQTLTVVVEGSGTVTSDPVGTPCTNRCEWTFERGERVDLRAVAAPGFALRSWSACDGTANCAVELDGPRRVTARFAAVPAGKASLDVEVRPSPGGEVTGPGITCGRDCSAVLDEGRTIELVAAQHSGYSFERWSGGGCSGRETTCEVRLDESRRVEAIFAVDPADPADPADPVDPVDPSEHELTVRLVEEDAGTVTSEPAGIDCPSTCRRELPAGTPVTLTAEEFDGWKFAEWEGDCSGQTCVLPMDEPARVTARFTEVDPPAAEKHAVLVRFAAKGLGGRVTSTPEGIDCASSCRRTLPAGTPVTLTVDRFDGWQFIGWSGDCSGPTCVLAMDEPANVSPRFERDQPQTYTLRTEAYRSEQDKSYNWSIDVYSGSDDVPEDCSTPCTYPAGTRVTARVTGLGATDPVWTGCRPSPGDKSQCTATMNKDRTITAQPVTPP